MATKDTKDTKRMTPKDARRRGFTVFELLMSLSIVGLIGGTVAAMLNSVAEGTSGQQDGRRFLVRMQALEERFASAAHGAQGILAVGSNYLVYWTGDTNIDNAVQLSEIGMFELNTATRELRQYRTVFPNWFNQAQIASADTTFAASTNWYAACQTAKSTYFTPATIATNVTAFSASVDSVSLPSLVTCNVTLSDGQVTRSVAATACIRNPMAPN